MLYIQFYFLMYYTTICLNIVFINEIPVCLMHIVSIVSEALYTYIQ